MLNMWDTTMQLSGMKIYIISTKLSLVVISERAL